MPSVYKFNLEQADFPYEQEDYGTLSGSVASTVDYGSGLPVQSEPDYSTDLYYPPTPTPSTDRDWETTSIINSRCYGT